MTVCLNGSEGLISEQSLLRVINSFVPPAILEKTSTDKLEPGKKNDGHRLVTRVLENSDSQLRLYGAADELYADLNKYRDICLDHRVFGYEFCEPYSRIPTVYDGMRGSYIAKADVFVHVQNLILNKYEIVRKNQLARSIIAGYLKLKEEKLKGSNNFVNCSDASFKAIEADLMAEIVKAEKGKKQKLLLNTGGLNELIPQFLSLLGESEKCSYIAKLVLDLITETGSQMATLKIFGEIYEACAMLIGVLDIVIQKHPKLFLSNPQSQTSMLLRVFVDGKKEFIPIEDTFLPRGLPRVSVVCDPGIWMTENKEDLMKLLPNNSASKEFDVIHIPITRTKHCASYVFNGKAEPCKLAIDVFYELCIEWIFGYKLFQKLKTESDWFNTFEKFFENRSWYFNSKQKKVLFLTQAQILSFRAAAKKLFGEIAKRPAKDIRNAKATGFTKENLTNELINLGLTTTFPKITESVELVYDAILRQSNGQYLTTADLFECVYQCQMIALLKKYPEWAEYVHIHNGCHRILDVQCSCPKQTKPASPKNDVSPAKKPRLNEQSIKELDLTEKLLAVEKKAMEFEKKLKNQMTLEIELESTKKKLEIVTLEKEELQKKLDEWENKNSELEKDLSNLSIKYCQKELQLMSIQEQQI